MLWDIDGTLLRAGSLARQAFSTAVERAVGAHPGDHGVAMSGKTDPQIVGEILDSMGTEAATTGHDLGAALGYLEEEMASAPERLRDRGSVLPGVEALLAHLDAQPGVVQSVLTGNIAANAALKLAVFGIDDWFDLRVGAFGSDNPDRCALVPVARTRARRLYGRHPEVVWVVGDTPNDLACAQAGGARCLLVATGRVPYDELVGLPADAVLRDLRDFDAVTALLMNGS